MKNTDELVHFMGKLREYWVIEDSRKNAVFGLSEEEALRGYIPRSIGEKIIGRKTKKGECVYFTKEQSEAMRKHPEFRTQLS